jgi:PPOX class probable F420-dependent enzyme
VDDRVRAFIEKNHHAVMTTLKKDGTPHVAMIAVGIVDGKLWSSGTETRVRTKHVRRDPRCTLMVLVRGNAYEWVGLETEVTVLDGEDAPQQNLALYRAITGKDPDDLDEYLEAMVSEQRLVYEFRVKRAYGQY